MGAPANRFKVFRKLATSFQTLNEVVIDSFFQENGLVFQQLGWWTQLWLSSIAENMCKNMPNYAQLMHVPWLVNVIGQNAKGQVQSPLTSKRLQKTKVWRMHHWGRIIRGFWYQRYPKITRAYRSNNLSKILYVSTVYIYMVAGSSFRNWSSLF